MANKINRAQTSIMSMDNRFSSDVLPENVKLFNEPLKSFEEAASEVIVQLGWDRASDKQAAKFHINTGLSYKTRDRIMAHEGRKWYFDTVFAFCMGAPIGFLRALYLLATIGCFLKPWARNDHLVYINALASLQGKPHEVWSAFVEEGLQYLKDEHHRVNN